jgi:hypothetical protein
MSAFEANHASHALKFRTRRSSTRGAPRGLFGNIGLICPVVTKEKSTHFAAAGTAKNYSGGGRNMTSCLADSATTSGGVCSFMLWMAQNRSYNLRVGVTQKKHFTVWSVLLKMP